ncbi:MAG: peptidase S8 [Candidatus Aminicenantes bacterium]|nr:MAG: peptidase S8 [Candidatus Aminicenantes bacterium]
MNKKWIIFMVVIAFSLILTADNGQPLQLEPEQEYVPNRAVIKISSDAVLEMEAVNLPHRPGEIRKDYPFSVLLHKYKSEIKHLQMHRIRDYYIAETTGGCDIEALCQRLRKEPYIADASPDYYAVLTSRIPDDTYFQYQYGLHNTGQVYLPETGLTGTAGSDIKAIDGWDWTTGSDDVIIAIIDSGVAADHEDLQFKIVPGRDYVNDDEDPYDDHGHGTFAASIAAAETNNGVGIAGVSWNAKIMPIKVMASTGYGSYLAIAEGMRYAVDHGAQVLNLSIGGRSPSFILEDACAYCYNNGAVIAAATGNTGSAVLYPAAYDDYCLAVAATDANDERPNWSNYGPQVDVAGPGYFVWGANYSPDDPDNLDSYHWRSGTSFATPHVAGAAALLIAYKPFLTNDQVMALIKYTADDVNASTHPGVDDFIGYGRINLQTLLGPYELNDE